MERDGEASTEKHCAVEKEVSGKMDRVLFHQT